jgi:hypothetical protein
MNTYTKFCPNVFVAKCTEQHQKGGGITLTTKYGKEVENEVHNYLGQTKDGFYLYSITRTDGTNSQTRAAAKAEKLEGYASNAEKRADQYYQASQEGKDFLALGEPIKIGHHSERRHRKLIERNWARMGKSVAETEKAKEYERRAEYWSARANKIDLSMPDSLEFFEFELEKARKYHQHLKDNPAERRHSMSLQYANKAVKDIEVKLKIAVKLWGGDDDQEAPQSEQKTIDDIKKDKEAAKSKLFEECRLFFAFSDSQLKEGLEKYPLAEGDKLVSIGASGYCPKSKAAILSDGLKQIEKDYKKAIQDNKQRRANILYELKNREAFYTGEIEETAEALGEDYTREEVKEVFNQHNND